VAGGSTSYTYDRATAAPEDTSDDAGLIAKLAPNPTSPFPIELDLRQPPNNDQPVDLPTCFYPASGCYVPGRPTPPGITEVNAWGCNPALAQIKIARRAEYNFEDRLVAATPPVVGSLSYVFTPPSDGELSVGAQVRISGRIGAYGSSHSRYGTAKLTLRLTINQRGNLAMKEIALADLHSHDYAGARLDFREDMYFMNARLGVTQDPVIVQVAAEIYLFQTGPKSGAWADFYSTEWTDVREFEGGITVPALCASQTPFLMY